MSLISFKPTALPTIEAYRGNALALPMQFVPGLPDGLGAVLTDTNGKGAVELATPTLTPVSADTVLLSLSADLIKALPSTVYLSLSWNERIQLAGPISFTLGLQEDTASGAMPSLTVNLNEGTTLTVAVAALEVGEMLSLAQGLAMAADEARQQAEAARNEANEVKAAMDDALLAFEGLTLGAVVADRAAMLALPTPPVGKSLTVLVESDANRDGARALYTVLPDGSRFWQMAMRDEELPTE